MGGKLLIIAVGAIKSGIDSVTLGIISTIIPKILTYIDIERKIFITDLPCARRRDLIGLAIISY